ncbi:hypothetical protein Sxan_54540 [Streptomyces xanthophaeus]|uniref:Uncharacterized protein n=1 Tax=Streptomyces xanthophaeus TaxID=67385 RepID=A0A919H0K2_9ACTN|nr:hypothetical protein Sxan_54540 [Streptomyces xanthophaeus]
MTAIRGAATKAARAMDRLRVRRADMMLSRGMAAPGIRAELVWSEGVAKLGFARSGRGEEVRAARWPCPAVRRLGGGSLRGGRLPCRSSGR